MPNGFFIETRHVSKSLRLGKAEAAWWHGKGGEVDSVRIGYNPRLGLTGIF